MWRESRSTKQVAQDDSVQEICSSPKQKKIKLSFNIVVEVDSEINNNKDDDENEGGDTSINTAEDVKNICEAMKACRPENWCFIGFLAFVLYSHFKEKNGTKQVLDFA